MKKKSLSFYTIVLLALALMGLIIVTQLFTNQSTVALKNGNIQAVETYKINNRMQLIVNLSFDLQSKFGNYFLPIDGGRVEKLSDSLTLLGVNTSILNSAISKLGYADAAGRIDTLVQNQIDHSYRILTATQFGNTSERNSLTDSLRRSQIGDKVYAGCLDVQKLLEKNLEQTLITNTKQAGVLSTYNRILAIIAIVAILLLVTVIIKRQSRQIQLIEELKLAESNALKSKNAKDHFVANMSHELRTPLNALIGFGNLLNKTDLNSRQREYADIIRSSGYNLLNIVNDVLDLSKIEAGKLRLVNKPFNINNVLADIERMFSASLAEKDLTYEWHIDKSIPANLKGDSERLKQILINLIGNAIKFTTIGGIQLNAGIVWEEEDSGTYKLGFTIKDSGSGIPNEKLQSIFERFEQLEHVTIRQHGGTGLGLTIVRNLVERMGGAISVYSEVGVGSEFSFTCVFEKAESATVNDQGKKCFDAYSLSNLKILAAEDNRANQTLLKHMLGKYKADITIVENGREVIDLLKQNNYDLVLMDIQMPVMDGYTAIKHIREELRSDKTIIAMTAYVSEDEIQKCLTSGFNGYIAKPIEEDILINLISKNTKEKASTAVHQSRSSDLGFLKELVGDDPGTIAEIITEMKNQWKIDRVELDAAVKESNTGEIKRILHRIKSTFSPLGPNHPLFLTVSGKDGEFSGDDNNIHHNEFDKFFEKIDAFTDAF